MLARFGTHVRRQFVGYLALFVALGGSAYAVTSLPANSVGTTQLKKDAVVSSKIKDQSIIGADINKSKLGPVNFARQAGDANKLGGNGPSAFLAANGKAADAAHADNATLLDNLASTDFLRRNGKAVDASHADNATTAGVADSATNALSLGGIAAAGFVQGHGHTFAYRQSITIPANTSRQYGTEVNIGGNVRVAPVCTTSPYTGNFIYITNLTSGNDQTSLDVFYDNGGSNPTLDSVASGQVSSGYLFGRGPERVLFQLGKPPLVSTIIVTSKQTNRTCLFLINAVSNTV